MDSKLGKRLTWNLSERVSQPRAVGSNARAFGGPRGLEKGPKLGRSWQNHLIANANRLGKNQSQRTNVRLKKVWLGVSWWIGIMGDCVLPAMTYLVGPVQVIDN